jgi:hypothetical protein
MNEDRITFADAFNKREIAELFTKVKTWQLQKVQRAQNERRKQLGNSHTNDNGKQNGHVQRP